MKLVTFRLPHEACALPEPRQMRDAMTFEGHYTQSMAAMAAVRVGAPPAKGKGFDTGNVLGPYIATRDEIEDPCALDMVARVDGEEWGRGNTADMYHHWEDVIAHVSRNETLHAGEVIGSGTVSNGCGLEFGRFLSPGALSELEVTGLGLLRNRLVRP